MSAPEPVGISAQDARVDFDLKSDQEFDPLDAAEQINQAFVLVRNDLQRLAQILQTKRILYFGSGNHRWVSQATGVADVWAVSDTATTGSGALNYHTLTLYRNGAAANTQTYDTRRSEVASYKDGNYLGQATVAVGDVLAINLATTGVPTALTTANLMLRISLQEN